ncbi:hypothetical protein [Flavobacterium sp. PL002]|uniref:hypothetical protein n=1 Tax=Flavobacterium sp. PL002 TaxID=1897058 RepID=UPI00178889C6|nr:hypothetical protein [Flavobacterium sp. PL002]
MKKIIVLLSFILLCSCNKTLDLSTLELGSNAKKHELESNKNLESEILKGHYEWKNINEKRTLITVDKGEEVTNYHEINKVKNQFNYSGIPTDSTWDVKIVVYKGEITEINARFAQENAFIFIEKILKKLGHPSKISFDTTILDSQIEKDIYLKLKKYFPKDTKRSKLPEYVDYQLKYPRDMLWDKDKVLYIVNIILDNRGNVSVNYRPMTKKACKDRVLYPAPLNEEKDRIPFYEYLK